MWNPFRRRKAEVSGTSPKTYMDWWRARAAALEPLLGPMDDQVLTAMPPIYVGGFADVMAFPKFPGGVAYVTGGLIGLGAQKPGPNGEYELMMCTRDRADWAANLISRLAPYTHEAVLAPGDTMETGRVFDDGTIAGLLCTEPPIEPTTFAVANVKATLLLCVGLTEPEMRACQAGKTREVYDALKAAGAHPWTALSRPSVV